MSELEHESEPTTLQLPDRDEQAIAEERKTIRISALADALRCAPVRGVVDYIDQPWSDDFMEKRSPDGSTVIGQYDEPPDVDYVFKFVRRHLAILAEIANEPSEVTSDERELAGQLHQNFVGHVDFGSDVSEVAFIRLLRLLDETSRENLKKVLSISWPGDQGLRESA